MEFQPDPDVVNYGALNEIARLLDHWEDCGDIDGLVEEIECIVTGTGRTVVH